MKHLGFGVDSQDLLPEESLSFTGLVTPSAAFALAVGSPVLEPVVFGSSLTFRMGRET